ncbi:MULTISPECIES: hypothetical protein [unclassified Pseudomonas]|uniref:hypothetical protein n=1 Tax=unclassified Pseudomonas TaxID=196821 RepID=UPI0025D3F739|nr:MULTISPECIES: hypothetical protein [unclassified Pseudomonas]
MKDAFSLLVAGVVVAVVAWGFWHSLWGDGFAVLNLVALVVLVADNFRLRRQLKRS